MDARISVITLGVAHIPQRGRSTRRSAGRSAARRRITSRSSATQARGSPSTGWTASPRRPGRRPPSPARSRMTLAMNVESRELVDACLEEALRAGGTLLRPAQDRFWGGYSGYFADPDGHAWEVAFNPFWAIGTDGLPILP